MTISSWSFLFCSYFLTKKVYMYRNVQSDCLIWKETDRNSQGQFTLIAQFEQIFIYVLNFSQKGWISWMPAIVYLPTAHKTELNFHDTSCSLHRILQAFKSTPFCIVFNLYWGAQWHSLKSLKCLLYKNSEDPFKIWILISKLIKNIKLYIHIPDCFNNFDKRPPVHYLSFMLVCCIYVNRCWRQTTTLFVDII